MDAAREPLEHDVTHPEPCDRFSRAYALGGGLRAAVGLQRFAASRRCFDRVDLRSLEARAARPQRRQRHQTTPARLRLFTGTRASGTTSRTSSRPTPRADYASEPVLVGQQKIREYLRALRARPDRPGLRRAEQSHDPAAGGARRPGRPSRQGSLARIGTDWTVQAALDVGRRDLRNRLPPGARHLEDPAGCGGSRRSSHRTKVGGPDVSRAASTAPFHYANPAQEKSSSLREPPCSIARSPGWKLTMPSRICRPPMATTSTRDCGTTPAHSSPATPAYEVEQRGVYSGPARIRAALGLKGPEGLRNPACSPSRCSSSRLIHVSEDGHSAPKAALAHAGDEGRTGTVPVSGAKASTKTNTVIEDGAWKISKLHYYLTFRADYDKGWTERSVADRRLLRGAAAGRPAD